MILVNSDITFIDLSGQVRCLNADLLLKPSASGKVLVRSRTDGVVGRYDSLIPETTLVQNLGSLTQAWGTSFISSGNFTDVYCANITVDGIARLNNALISGLVVNINATINSLTMGGSIDMQGRNILNASTIQGQLLDFTPGGDINLGTGNIRLSNIINCNTLRVHSSGSMKALAMSGNIDMGGNNIVTVGLVDGVDVSAHRTRHQDGGADEIDVTNLAGLLADAQNINIDDTSVLYLKNGLTFTPPTLSVDNSFYIGFNLNDIGTSIQVDIITNAGTVLFNAAKGGKILKHTTIDNNVIINGHLANLSGITTSGTLNMLGRPIVNVSGIIMSNSGIINMSSGIISGLAVPTAPSHAATKQYVDLATYYIPSGNVLFRDHFLLTAWRQWENNTAGGGLIYPPNPAFGTTASKDRLGVVRIDCSTGTTNWINMYAGSQSIIADAGLELTTNCLLGANPTGMIFRWGLGSSSDNTTPSDALYFEYDKASSSNWRLVSKRDGSTTTLSTNVPVAISSYMELSITVTQSGTNPTNNLAANFYLNGSGISSITTNIPSGTSDYMYLWYYLQQNQTNGFAFADVDEVVLRKFKLA